MLLFLLFLQLPVGARAWRMAVLDNSIDIFGTIVTVGSVILGTRLLKPDWPFWPVVLSITLTFLVAQTVLPGRKLRKTE